MKVGEGTGEERGVIEEELVGRQENKEEDEQVSCSLVRVMVTFFDWILRVLM